MLFIYFFSVSRTGQTAFLLGRHNFLQIKFAQQFGFAPIFAFFFSFLFVVSSFIFVFTHLFTKQMRIGVINGTYEGISLCVGLLNVWPHTYCRPLKMLFFCIWSLEYYTFWRISFIHHCLQDDITPGWAMGTLCINCLCLFDLCSLDCPVMTSFH